MHQQCWGYKTEEKIYLGVSERRRLNVTGLADTHRRYRAVYCLIEHRVVSVWRYDVSRNHSYLSAKLHVVTSQNAMNRKYVGR